MGFLSYQESESVSLSLTKEVLREQGQLHVLVEGLHFQIAQTTNKLEEMRQEEIVLNQRESEIALSTAFTYQVEVTNDVREDLSGTGRHTTTCITCNLTCHLDCKIPDEEDKYNCWAMDNSGSSSKCRICPRNCMWSNHKNRPHLIRNETVIDTRTDEQLKMKYHRAKERKATVDEMMKCLQDLAKVHDQVLTNITIAQQSLPRLDEIALRPNLLTEVEHLNCLLNPRKGKPKLDGNNA